MHHILSKPCRWFIFSISLFCLYSFYLISPVKTLTNIIPRWVFAMAGSAYMTVLGNSTGFYINGGEFGEVFEADTADISMQGHRSQYVGVSEVVAVQVPPSDGKIPEHTLLHEGFCQPEDLLSVRGLVE
jgi:hypothetical protein